MNLCILKGNLTRDPDLRFTPGSGIAVCKFSIAVSRFKKEDGADFINCTSFGKTAEIIANHFTKGKPILLEGRIQTGSYEKDGKKVYTTDVIVNKFEFISSKEKQEAPEGFSEVLDEDIPY